MEKYTILYHMNNGEQIHIVEEHEDGFDFNSLLSSTQKWSRHGRQIINLDNVNYIDVKAEMIREDMEEFSDGDFEFWN